MTAAAIKTLMFIAFTFVPTMGWSTWWAFRPERR